MLDSSRITHDINKHLSEIGINPEVNGVPSHTANLVALIVENIVRAIQNDAEVRTTVNTRGVSSPPGSIEIHTGEGIGAPGSIL